MTQAQLAERIGVARQAIIATEQGHYSPSLEAAFQIAGFFQRPVEEVFLYPEERPGQRSTRRPSQAARSSISASTPARISAVNATSSWMA